MDIEDKKVIFTSKDEREMNKAADYMKECKIDCLVENAGKNEFQLYVDQKLEKKARKLIEEFFSPQPVKKGKAEAEEEWEEEAGTGSGYGFLGILGIILLVVTIAVAITGYAMGWAQIKLINIILVSLTLAVNGYVGIFQRKTLGTALFILCLVGLFFVIVKPAPKVVPQDAQALAMTYMNAGDYPSALQQFEKALEEVRQKQDVQSEAFILSYMANIYKERNLIDRSLEYYQMALDLFVNSGLEDMKKIIQPEIDKIKAEYGK